MDSEEGSLAAPSTDLRGVLTWRIKLMIAGLAFSTFCVFIAHFFRARIVRTCPSSLNSTPRSHRQFDLSHHRAPKRVHGKHRHDGRLLQ